MGGRSFLGVFVAIAGCLPADELQNYSDGSPPSRLDPVSSAPPPPASADVERPLALLPLPDEAPTPDAARDAEESEAQGSDAEGSEAAPSEAAASEADPSEADPNEADPNQAAASEPETSPQPLLDPEPVPAPAAPDTSSGGAGDSEETAPPMGEGTPAEDEPEPPAPAAPPQFRFVRLVADSSVQGPYTSIAEFNLIDGDGVVIDRSAWVASADSEEEVHVGGAAARFAIDGDPSTMWHTAWLVVSPAPAHPHTLDIDMGSLHEVGGFRYLARQDGSLDGRVAAFRFFVSVDGQEWGEPVSSGTLANTDQEQEIRLP